MRSNHRIRVFSGDKDCTLAVRFVGVVLSALMLGLIRRGLSDFMFNKRMVGYWVKEKKEEKYECTYCHKCCYHVLSQSSSRWYWCCFKTFAGQRYWRMRLIHSEYKINLRNYVEHKNVSSMV